MIATPALRACFRRLVPAFALLWLSAMPAFAQKLGQGADDDVSVWRVLAALLLCMVLAIAGAFMLRSGHLRLGAGRGLAALFPTKCGPAKRGRRLAVVETVRLGHQAELSIVTCDGEDLLVSSSAQGVALVAKLPQPAGKAGPA
jgi:hypothetical protein